MGDVIPCRYISRFSVITSEAAGRLQDTFQSMYLSGGSLSLLGWWGGVNPIPGCLTAQDPPLQPRRPQQTPADPHNVESGPSYTKGPGVVSVLRGPPRPPQAPQANPYGGPCSGRLMSSFLLHPDTLTPAALYREY